MKNKKMFPMFTDLSDKKIVVIGGGTIATRRIRAISDFADDVVVVSPELSEKAAELAADGSITWIKDTYREKYLEGAYIVIAATDNKDVNLEIWEKCRETGTIINIASDQSKCDFHFPGLILGEEYVIGFNGGGASPAKTKALREKVENFLKTSEVENE